MSVTKVCQCGARLVRKGYESQAQFKKRKYCGYTCKGKYHKDPPRANDFGNLVPRNKSQRRVGKGMLSYFYSKPV